MHRYRRAALAAIVLGTGPFGLALQPATTPTHAAPLVRDRIFAGLQGGAIYTSSNAGESWHKSSSGLPARADVSSLAVVPGGYSILAGTGGAGVYLSTDDGRSWHDDNGDSPILSYRQIRTVIAPSNGLPAYAATSDGYVGRSIDGGRHWQTDHLPIRTVLTTLARDEGHLSTLFAGTTGDGLLISTDSGATWGTPARNIPASVSINAIAAARSNYGLVYAGTDDGIYQSTDEGATWRRQSRGIPDGVAINTIAVDPTYGTPLLAGDIDGNIYRSRDGGTSWTPTAIANSAQINALLYDPARPGTILAGVSDSGIYRSTDHGARWSIPRNASFPGGSVLCLAINLEGDSLVSPVDPPPAGLKEVQYFAQTGHTVRGAFYAFYHRYGDLKVFGLPLSEAFADHGPVMQYFERARLEITADGVRESHLGTLLTAGRAFPPVPPSPVTAGSRYFAATHHSLSGRFLDFWTRHHGQLLFGESISQPLTEQNGDGTGHAYILQYLQNARLEYHPELAGTGNEVQLGLLGRQYLQQTGHQL